MAKFLFVLSFLCVCAVSLYSGEGVKPEVKNDKEKDQFNTMTKEAIDEIIKKEHSDKVEVKELRVYGDSRKHQADVKIINEGKEVSNEKGVIITSKYVDGKYLVSQVHTPVEGYFLYFVTEYDKENGLYKRWVRVVFKEGKIDELKMSVGFRIKGSNVISWTGRDHDMTMISQELIEKDSIKWTDLMITKEGKIHKTIGSSKPVE